MSNQKITLSPSGVVQFGNQRMRFPTIKGAAKTQPAVKVHRLKELLKTQKPRICVIRGEGIGDVITATPTVRAIKEMFPHCELTFATNTRYMNGALVKVLQYNPDISQIIERDLMDDINFDLEISLHCPAMRHEVPRAIPPSRIDLFASHAGVPLKDPVPKFYPVRSEVEAGEKLLQAHLRDKLMLVQVQASAGPRSIDPAKLKQALIDLHNKHRIRSVVVTHSTDRTSNVLFNNIPGVIYLKDLDIRQIAGVMVHCNLVLCPDSSILHLAGALSVPCVGLFGPTPPASRIGHYKQCTGIWRGDDIQICPCFYSACPTNYSCWSRITVDDIVSTCMEHLASHEKANVEHLLNLSKDIQIQTEVI